MPVDLPLAPLRLEAARDYADTAVDGGLAGLMERWARSASAAVGAEEARQAILRVGLSFADYKEADREERERLVHSALEALRALSLAVGKPAEPELPSLTLEDPVTELKGISDNRAEVLTQLEIRTIGDLLRHYPFRYEDRRHITELAAAASGQKVIVSVEVTSHGRTHRRGGRQVTTVPVRDGSGKAELIWYNQPYRQQQCRPGLKLVASGTARLVAGKLSIQSPECEALGKSQSLHMRRIVPIHPTTKGLSPTMLRGFIHQALERTADIDDDPLPPGLLPARELLSAPEARQGAHFPKTQGEANQARRRLAYEELFVIQTLLAMRRRLFTQPEEGIALPLDGRELTDLEAALPFEPTAAQRRVLGIVSQDLQADRPALRLIHGDVGSGKTVIAAYALLAAVRAGKQAAFMAPTEILATQHERVLHEVLRPLGVQPVLLKGSLRTADKDRIRAGLKAGDIPLVVGTHALLQRTTEFHELAVAVVDEQHRFGVLQRASLAGKGQRPHLFVMTATPIPRTLALVAYGDCDVSVLDELPAGRRPPQTRLVPAPDRAKAYAAVRETVEAGHQAFVVCPLIEESESLQAEAAEKRFEELREGELSGVRVDLLHGRLRSDIGADRADAFRRGETDVLVCTTVIEVGVDVPAATVMVIENAERFGLAQLHQLRGRVGRGETPGTCYLIAGVARSNPAWERLEILEGTSDGFEVAEHDLRLRGPGELAGTRQAGMPDLRIADILADTALMEAAREDAFALIDEDPTLAKPEHEALRHIVHSHMPTLLPLMRVD